VLVCSNQPTGQVLLHWVEKGSLKYGSELLAGLTLHLLHSRALGPKHRAQLTSQLMQKLLEVLPNSPSEQTVTQLKLELLKKEPVLQPPVEVQLSALPVQVMQLEAQ